MSGCGSENPAGQTPAVSGTVEGNKVTSTNITSAAPSPPPLQARNIKEEALVTEVRLQGGKPTTRLAHPWWSGNKDDGYYSSDSTPKGFGGDRGGCLLVGDGTSPLPPSPESTPNAPREKSASLSICSEKAECGDCVDRTITSEQSYPLNKTRQSISPPDDGRESWGKSMDFLLSIIGFAVDLANVWRFPFLCYRNGGGAFLLPYFLITVFGALPLFFMELVLGQYNRQGPITVWKICPLFRGIGYCAVLVAYFVSFYYNVIIAWSIHFVYASFSYVLPWTHCDNEWNTENCWDGVFSGSPKPNNSNLTSPSEEYFNLVVLQMHKSEGLNDLGALNPGLVICGFITYLLLYLSLFKGVKSSGKVVWVTATLPYVILTLLLIRGALLPGASDGLLYYIKPSISALSNMQVWYEAAQQVFFSVGAGFGVHLSYASYNTFNNNCYRDCLITSFVNAITSFYSGLVIFTYLGYMAHKQNTPISEVATDGPGLVFQVYPEAVATLPGSQAWSCLFFLMLITLGLDSGMGGLECVLTGLSDELKETFGRKIIRREFFTAIVVGSSFLVAMVNFCQGGMYFFHWLDTYAAGISLLFSAMMEAIAIGWFYGSKRFCIDIKKMLGFTPNLYWRICWKIVSPLIILITILIGAVSLATQPLQYHGTTTYVYPWWSEVIGWIISLSSMFMIPLWMVISITRQPGSTLRQKLLLSITPYDERQAVIDTCQSSRSGYRHWLSI
ncbi:UNVERIFIED_CONTAM: hypothetical protein RMT77_000226 [Armadillidium vulgare]